MSQHDPLPNDDDAEPEQLAETDVAPRGEHRDDSKGFLFSNRENVLPSNRRRAGYGADAKTDISPPPSNINYNYREYYLEFPFVQAALRIFDETVVEPGWDVEARVDGEIDEDMTDALSLWGENCAIHAGEPGHDIIHILSQCPSKRRTKPAVFVEKVGTSADPDSLAAIQLLDPSTVTIRLRKNQNLVVHPDDDVDRDHPMTEDGDAAAYVQYDDDAASVNAWDEEQIPFTVDDITKLVYDPPEGSPWGRTIWPAVADAVEGLKQKLRDRNAAIRLAGHPHRIYSSDTWTKDQAEDFANAHERGDVSAWEDQEETGFGARVDFVPHQVNVQVESGTVADIEDAVMDDIEAIFSMLPVSKFKIAYEEGINQFVVEPQQEKDNLWIDKERRYLESKFGELFREKADELAGGDTYEGEIDFKVRQPASDNPLERDGFDPERFQTFIDAFTSFSQSNAVVDFPVELVYFAAGMDKDEFEAEYGAPDELEPIDEDDPDVQEAAEAMGFPTGALGEHEDSEDTTEDADAE